ncbi:MAG: YdcF family protein [Myxococcales bacterium]|nr:YdcF family protein [Myxococcales bacterium]
MFIVLSKVLPPLLLPTGLSLWLGGAALILFRSRPRAARGLLAAGLLVLGLAATPLCSDALLRSLEDRHPLAPAVQSPVADAIVVLGGGTTGRSAEQPEVEISASGGRLLHGLRLYQAGKAPLLILSGGGLGDGESEAEQMRTILREWGVPDRALLLEPRSRNTYENAVETVELAARHRLRRLLLVTSAFHMPRALALFRRQGRARGIDIVPSPTGRYTGHRRPFRLLAVLPDAGALANSTLALREQLGLAVYWLRGWL